MAGLSDNAKSIFYLVKEANEKGMDVTSANIAEKLGLGVKSVDAIITFTFGNKKDRETKEIIRPAIMEREKFEVEYETEDGKTKKKTISYIRLVDKNFDPEAVPEEA